MALESIPKELFEDRVIFFQEISEEDRCVAAKFGFRAEGNNKNQGIREGIKSAVSACQADVVLYLENDCLLIESGEDAKRQILRAAQRISQGELNVCRMRHARNPGHDYSGYKKFLRYWSSERETRFLQKLLCGTRRLLRPDKAIKFIGQAVMESDQPHLRFPKWIKELEPGLMRVSSRVIPWTNQAILVDKAWILSTLFPYAEAHPRSASVNGFQSLEPPLNCRWWRNQNFSVGQSLPGLFTHHRVDRPVGDQKTLIHEEIVKAA